MNHLGGAFLPGFLWPVVLLCPVLSPCSVYLHVLKRYMLPLARMDSSEEGSG